VDLGIWGFVFEQAFGHAFCIWGFVFEQAFWHLGIRIRTSILAFGHLGIRIRTSILTNTLTAAVVVAPRPPCGGSVRWRGGAGGVLKTAGPRAGGATRGDGCSDEGHAFCRAAKRFDF
jgi:hypothetical protein